jgi:hypothetical protein
VLGRKNKRTEGNSKHEEEGKVENKRCTEV